jgi:hypothetical protein
MEIFFMVMLSLLVFGGLTVTGSRFLQISFESESSPLLAGTAGTAGF